ncbi:hypothetical protein VUR80DRAFT_6445 [Thermomyces stellatus]
MRYFCPPHPHSRTHRAGFPLPILLLSVPPASGTVVPVNLDRGDTVITLRPTLLAHPFSPSSTSLPLAPCHRGGDVSSPPRIAQTPKYFRTLPAPVLRPSPATPSPHSRLLYRGPSCLGRTDHPPTQVPLGALPSSSFTPSIFAEESGLQSTRTWSTSRSAPRGPRSHLRAPKIKLGHATLALLRIHNCPAPTAYLGLTLPPSRQALSSRTSTSY